MSDSFLGKEDWALG